PRMRLENIVAGEGAPDLVGQGLQRLDHPRLPIDQRAVAVECEGLEIGELHLQFLGRERCLRVLPRLSIIRPLSPSAINRGGGKSNRIIVRGVRVPPPSPSCRSRGRMPVTRPIQGLCPLRIATWNVNSVRQRLPHLLDYLKEVKPDALCLQEIKCLDEQFPRMEIEELG